MAIGDKLFVADKATLDAVNTKTGTNADAAGTTTIFARLKQIYDYLVGNLSSTRAAKIDNLDATISSRQAGWGATATHSSRIDTTISSRAAQTTADTINSNLGSNASVASATGDVHAKLKDIKSALATTKNTVTVQRGLSYVTALGTPINVTISPVDMSKTFVLISWVVLDGNNVIQSDDRANARARLTSSNNLELAGTWTNGGSKCAVSWEVIQIA